MILERARRSIAGIMAQSAMDARRLKTATFSLLMLLVVLTMSVACAGSSGDWAYVNSERSSIVLYAQEHNITYGNVKLFVHCYDSLDKGPRLESFFAFFPRIGFYGGGPAFMTKYRSGWAGATRRDSPVQAGKSAWTDPPCPHQIMVRRRSLRI